MATGRSVDEAINHDPAAIAMHEANHPQTRHHLTDVWRTHPLRVAAGRRVGLLWLSPDCTHHSKARGGKPRKKEIRGLAWVGVWWAATVRPRVIILENVEEFVTWGPLDKDGQPIKEQSGRTFRSFVNALRYQGYDVEWRELRACDYGAPTIRKRFFLIARCDGQKIVWPEPTHGNPASEAVKSGRLNPWRTAAEIIDWSIPCPSIFERKKPLAENTLRRIARGIQRFVIENPSPFIIKVNHKYDQFRGQQIDDPMQTITATNGWGLVSPVLAGVGGRAGQSRPRSGDEPLATTTAKADVALITPYIARIGQTGFGGDRLQYELDDPLTTVTTKAEHLLVTPVLGVNTSGHPGSSPDEPLRTVTTGNHHMVVSPTLIEIGYGEGPGQSPRAPGLQKPLGTVVAGGRKHALVEATLAVPHITKFRGGSIGHAIDDPLHTITSGAGASRPAGAAHAMGMVTAFLAKHYGGNYTGPGSSLEDPISTITTTDHNALVTSHLIKLRGTCQDGQEVTVPMPTITAGGMHVGEVRAFLLKYYGSADNGQTLDGPLHTVTTKDRFGLVTIEGIDYQIVDIGMRMLEPHELYAAQGFPSNYIIDGYMVNGRPVSKAAKVARCGNSVPPPFAKAFVRANLPEHCTGSGNAFRFERYTDAVGQLQLSM